MKTSKYCTLAGLIAIVLSAVACSHVGMMELVSGVTRPAAEEFGFGPRISAERRYVATLQPQQTVRPRQLQTMRVAIADGSGQGIDGASILVDGGMPQHGHGLPTQPRVTKKLGGGIYEIEGVRFNMGGWWELKLAINGAAGTDLVTFNLDL